MWATPPTATPPTKCGAWVLHVLQCLIVCTACDTLYVCAPFVWGVMRFGCGGGARWGHIWIRARDLHVVHTALQQTDLNPQAGPPPPPLSIPPQRGGGGGRHLAHEQ